MLMGEGYTERTDLFSLGVVVCEMLTGRHPFGWPYDRGDVVARRIVSGEMVVEEGVWCELSGEAKDFVVGLLQMEEAGRPSAAGALWHPWVASRGSEVEGVGCFMGRMMGWMGE